MNIQWPDASYSDIARTLVIVVVIWGIGAIPSAKWRAIVYSLPIPITLVLVSTQSPIVSGHVWGVLALVIFFQTTLLVRSRGIALYASVLVGTTTYTLLALFSQAAPDIAVWQAALLASIILITMVSANKKSSASDALIASDLFSPRRVGSIVGSALGAWALGSFLGPFLVTFPYSGIPLALDSGTGLQSITVNVTRNSFALVGFFVAASLAPPNGTMALRIAAGWFGFLVILLLINGRPLLGLLSRRAGPS